MLLLHGVGGQRGGEVAQCRHVEAGRHFAQQVRHEAQIGRVCGRRRRAKTWHEERIELAERWHVGSRGATLGRQRRRHEAR